MDRQPRLKTRYSLLLRKAQKITLAFCALAWLSACTPPSLPESELSETAIKQEQTAQFAQALSYQSQQSARLAEVSYPLLKHNTNACGKRLRYNLGIILHHPQSYPKQQQAAVAQLYGEGNYSQILHVIEQGPSYNILQTGDEIIKIADHPAEQKLNKTLQNFKSALSSGQTLTLTVRRSGAEQVLTIRPEQVCDYPVILSSSDAINGYADGSQIIITAGLMRFANKDEELAQIIAHELAHNTLQHIQQRLKNGALGGLLDLVLISNGIISPGISAGISANLYSQRYELQADLEGIKLMQQAGYDISSAANFWREMAMLHPAMITHRDSLSHPTSVERFLEIQRYVEQIQQAEKQ